MKQKLICLIFLSVFGLCYAQEKTSLSSESKLTIYGTSTLHDWTVTANEISGNATLKDKLPNSLTFEVTVAKIKSERGSTMDKKMYNALKGDEHPKIVFLLTETSNDTIKGKLTVAGHEKPVEIPVKMNTNNGSLHIKGEHPITLKDYDMKPPRAMFGQIVVGDTVTVKFNLKF